MKSFVVEKPKLTGEPQKLSAFGDQLEFDEVSFAGVEAESTNLEKISIIDGVLEKCNLSAAKVTESLWQRVKILDSRMSGIVWYDAILKDVEFVNCKIDLANFRATKFKNVIFRDCLLSGSDWQGAELTNVIFEACDINDIDLNSCTMKNVDLSSSTFTNIKGVRGLAGVTMTRQQLIMLAPIFANELGIKIED